MYADPDGIRFACLPRKMAELTREELEERVANLQFQVEDLGTTQAIITGGLICDELASYLLQGAFEADLLTAIQGSSSRPTPDHPTLMERMEAALDPLPSGLPNGPFLGVPKRETSRYKGQEGAVLLGNLPVYRDASGDLLFAVDALMAISQPPEGEEEPTFPPLSGVSLQPEGECSLEAPLKPLETRATEEEK